MLSFLRRGGFIQFVMAAIVMLIIAAFAFDYRVGQASLQQECVIRLPGRCVPPKDFFSSFRFAVPPYMEAKEIQQQGLRQHVIDGLIERELLLREAHNLGVGVGEEELDKELAVGRVHYSLPVAQYTLRMSRRFELEPNEMATYIPVRNSKGHAFDFKIYKRSVLNFARMSTKDFKEKQEQELLAARMRLLIMSQVRVAEPEAFAQYARENSKAIARVSELRQSWFARFAIFPTPEQEQEFAKGHADKLDAAWEARKAVYTANCADISEIVIALDITGSEEEKATATKKLTEASPGLDSAEAFALAARRLSTAPSAQHGGRVGCFSTDGDPDAQKVAETVATLKPGRVSGVVATDTSVRLVRLHATLAGPDLATVGKQVALAQLTSEALAQEQLQQFATQLIAAAQGGKTLEQAIQEQAQALLARSAPKGGGKALQQAALEAEDRPKVEISTSFTIAGNPLPGAESGSPAALVFALQKADDLHPTPIATRDGLAVLQLKEKTLATHEDFEAKKEQVMRELRLRKQADALVSYVKRLRDGIQSQIKVDSRYLNEASDATEDG